jgi:hypothetical protein
MCMKKYKLSKWYPGLPEEWKTSPATVTKFYNVYKLEKGDYFHLNKSEIEDNPEFWQPVQEPLFVTEDGVEIFDDMLTYRVMSNYQLFGPGYYTGEMPGTKYFSTLESAEKYVRLNKPRYSLRQICDFLNEYPANPYVDIDEIETNLEDYKY